MKFVAVLLVCLAASVSGRELLQAVSPAPAITDADVLNFALNLEYLEAEFYSWAAFGYGLPAELRGGGPPSFGGQKAQLSGVIQAYAAEIATDEINHVKFLRSALGEAAVPMPLINIGVNNGSFGAAAEAAFNTMTPAFNPYGNDLFFLLGAYIFEDVGVTAYKGGAPLIANPAFLEAAAGILAVEAYHAGAIRTLLIQNGGAITPYGVNVSTASTAISNLRKTVDGSFTKDEGVFTAAGAPNIVPADENSIAFSRSPEEVLDIVYLGSSTTPGGFYPNGLNGLIK